MERRERNRRRRRRYGMRSLLVFVVGMTLMALYGVNLETSDGDISYSDLVSAPGDQVNLSPAASSRHLLAVRENCTPAAIERFPHLPIILTADIRRHGGVILHVIIAAYMFLGLALVCDDYFVPACELISEKLGLQEDVAGATFLAAGSSAPELATTVIGVFVTKDDIALGAVVGSAVFNVMLVPGLCAVWAAGIIYLRWWPLCRDCLYYALSIVALVLCIYDNVIMWYDALCLVCLYVGYIILMYFNPTLDEWFTNKCKCMPRPHNPEVLPLQTTSAGEPPKFHILESDGEESVYQTLLSSAKSEAGLCGTDSGPIVYEKQVESPAEESEESNSLCTVPVGCWPRVLWAVSLPLNALLYISIPNCKSQRFYVASFLVSILWIGAFSYIMVWMITVIGHTAGIPDTVMGLTFIAAGSSVPDAIASLIVVQEGHGDMAMSNAVASNVFDILLCLGLPWLLQTTVGDARTSGVTIYSSGLLYCSVTLLSTVVLLLVATHLNKWRLTKGYGVFLIIIYAVFNIIASLYELNVFTYVHPPECPTSL